MDTQHPLLKTRASLVELLRARADARRSQLKPQVDRALSCFRSTGVGVEIVGSWARGEFGLSSDIDILITDRGGLSDGQIFAIALDNIKNAKVDIVYADLMSEESLALMRGDARPPLAVSPRWR